MEVSGAGAAFTGRIVSLEARSSAAGGDESKPAPERRLLTVAGDGGGVHTLELTGATVVRLLDAPLRTDLNSYLAVLDANRSEGVRHLTLTDRGTGVRDLRVSFFFEVPIWKLTYRIFFTDSPTAAKSTQTATLQGLSVTDNTTGEDWKNVQLSLVARSPQSFLQPLAQPVYSRRPEIPIAQDAQLTPQTHDLAGTTDATNGPVALQAPTVAGMEGVGGSAGGVAGGTSGGVGFGSGSGEGIAQGGPLALNGRSIDRLSQFAKLNAAPMAPYETLAADSTIPSTTTATFDDYFAYNLTDPVTIPRNGSALVPILETKIDSERVSL